jgi:hypothetical protein
MLDANVVGILIENLGQSDWHFRQSTAQALAKLAKHGAHSDPGAMQRFTSNQVICVAPCWISMSLPSSVPT